MTGGIVHVKVSSLPLGLWLMTFESASGWSIFDKSSLHFTRQGALEAAEKAVSRYFAGRERWESRDE